MKYVCYFYFYTVRERERLYCLKIDISFYQATFRNPLRRSSAMNHFAWMNHRHDSTQGIAFGKSQW